MYLVAQFRCKISIHHLDVTSKRVLRFLRENNINRKTRFRGFSGKYAFSIFVRKFDFWFPQKNDFADLVGKYCCVLVRICNFMVFTRESAKKIKFFSEKNNFIF